jgi:anthranilate/para-aminobenzoate synthase component I
VSDLLERLLERAGSIDTAGYFEIAPPEGRVEGRAFSFVDPGTTIRLRRSTHIEDLTHEVAEHLSRGRGATLVGYIGFDAVGLFEPLLRTVPAGSPFPLGEFALVDRVRWEKVRVRRGRSGRPPRADLPAPIADSMDRDRYCRSVTRLRSAIRDGEAFQVVLAHRRSWTRPDDLYERIRALRESERYAYFYYLKFGANEILGVSPESVIEVRGRRAYLNPIAGTVPLGREGSGRQGLKEDPKELAEHRMLVDLARNDLGRISEPGSVRLLFQERRERFARLEHLVSRVRSTLRPGVGPLETLAAAFPAGTVSGAPKIRATQLLRKEEGSWRGPYAGAVGVVDAHGEANWALAIRSAFAHGQQLFTAAGAGIVYGSRPAQEFQETLTKLEQVESSLVGTMRT